MNPAPPVQFKEMPAMRIIGIQVEVPVGEPNNPIPRLWDTIEKRKQDIKKMIQPEQCLGYESYTDDLNYKRSFLYTAAFVVEKNAEIPEGMVSHDIPAGLYAVFTHIGGIMDIHKTIRYAFKEYLPKSKYQVRAKYDFEWYDERFRGMRPESEVDFYIPVEEIK